VRHRPLVAVLILVLVVAASVAACSSSDSSASSVTSMTTAVAVADESVLLPGPGEPWDVLFFTQEDIFTRDLAVEYASLASAELGVEVRSFQPLGFDYVWAAILVPQLRGTAYPPLDEFVPPAEIIVLFSRPGEAPEGRDQNIVEDFERCWKGAVNGKAPTTDLPAEYWDGYRSDLDEVYAEIWALRQGTPTVVRTIDVYNPSLPQQREGGIEAECTAWFEAWSGQIEEAAAIHGSTFVSTYDLFNGPTHDLDPAEAGYIGPTADNPDAHWYQATPTGFDLIAKRLAEEGFTPAPQP
jgi:hypothetical protein